MVMREKDSMSDYLLARRLLLRGGLGSKGGGFGSRGAGWKTGASAVRGEECAMGRRKDRWRMYFLPASVWTS